MLWRNKKQEIPATWFSYFKNIQFQISHEKTLTWHFFIFWNKYCSLCFSLFFNFSMQKSVKFSSVKLKINSSFIRKVVDGMAKAKAKRSKRNKIPLIKIMPFVYSTFFYIFLYFFEIGSPLNVFLIFFYISTKNKNKNKRMELTF